MLGETGFEIRSVHHSIVSFKRILEVCYMITSETSAAVLNIVIPFEYTKAV